MPSSPNKPRMASAIISIAIVLSLLVTYTIGAAMAETYVFDGSARSKSHITQTTTIHVSGLNPAQIPNGSKIYYNASYPTSSSVSGYSISISGLDIQASPEPASISNVRVDKFGNPYRQLVWDIGPDSSTAFDIVVTTSFDADIKGDLTPVSYEDAVGTNAYPEYRSPTSMVQSADPAIVSKKNALLSGVTSEAEAVDRILDFVKANMPEQDAGVAKDAVSSLTSNKGNCVNRAHLALALLRSAGIPARCVHGLIYADNFAVSYNINGGKATTQIGWGEGSHVWIEVYYPDEGKWVAYDPFMDKGFVDSRHIKLYTGRDADPTDTSTRGDVGILYVSGANPSISFNTEVSASGLQDTITLHHKYTEPSPSGQFMIGRQMLASSAPSATPTVTPTPNNTTANATVTVTVNPTLTITPVPTYIPISDMTKHNVTGAIVDASSGAAVPDATVLLDAIQISASQAGKFAFLHSVTNGSYVLTVSAPGYLTEKQVLMPNNADLDVKVKLVALANATSPTPTAKPSPAPDLLIVLGALACGGLLGRKRAP